MKLRRALRFLGHQHYLRFGVRDRVVRYFDDPDKTRSEEFTVPFDRGMYRGNFDTFIDWSVYYYSAYSREELRLIADVLLTLDSPVFVDVGANVGHHTLFAALHSRLVLAFEPFEAVAWRLTQKITENHLSNVRLFNFALGDHTGLSVYTPPNGHNTGTGSFVGSSESAGPALQLPIRRGDDVLVEMGIEKVDFIKIDTEGYEPFVLAGLRQTLTRSRPIIFFEWSENQRQLSDGIASSLFPERYRFYQFVSDTVVCVFFRRPAYRLELLTRRWPDGYLLAVPEEYVRRVKAELPSSTAARCL
jgi:FkbM family methyltransferase